MRSLRIVVLLGLFGAVLSSPAEEALPKHAVARIGSTLWRVPDSYGFGITPDSKTIAVPFAPREIRFWDAVTGKTTGTLTGPVLPIQLSFTQDGKKLLFRADLGKLQLWDVTTSKEEKEYLRQDRIISLAQIAPDGKWLAAVSGESGKFNELTVWGTASGRAFFSTQGDVKTITGLAVAHDGATLATVGTEGNVRVWDPATGDEVAKFAGPKEAGFTSHLAYSKDGKLLVVITGREVRVWDLSKKTATAQFALPTNAVALSSEGERIAVVQGGSVDLWDTKEQKKVKTFGENITSFGQTRFSPDGSFLALLSAAGQLRVWDISTGQERGAAAGHASSVASLAFLPDGKTLLSSGDDNATQLWDAGSGKLLRRFGSANAGLPRSALAPDGKTLAAGGAYGAILVYDTTSGKELLTLKDPARSFAFSPDGKTLASVTNRRNDETVRIWDLSTGKERVQFASVATRPSEVLYSPDGKRLAVAGLTGRSSSTTLLDVETGKAEGTLEGRPIGFSSDGKRLATVDGDGLRIWTTADRKQEKSLPVRGVEVTAAAWSSDGKQFAVGQGSTVTLIDATTGKELGRLSGHTDNILSLAFSPDGSRLASGGKDSMILVWDITSVSK